MNLPDTIDADLAEILGIPNFRAGPIAHLMRIAGADIPRKAEAEQAHVLFKLLSIYAEHGAGWRMAAGEWLELLNGRATAAKQ